VNTHALGAAFLCLVASQGCLENIEPFEVPPDVTASYSTTGMQRLSPARINCAYAVGDPLSALEKITFTNQRTDGPLQVFLLEPGACNRVLQGTLAPGESVKLRATERKAPFAVTAVGQEDILSAWIYVGAVEGATVLLLP
jgi:hypothetical protein